MRVSEDAPKMYFFGCNIDDTDCNVILVDRDNAVITQIKNGSFAIPTKYLVKVGAEKGAKYHKGEKVRYNGYVYEVEGLVGKNRYAIKGLNFDLDEGMIDPYEPYTEPTEQTEAEKPNVGSIKIPVEVDLDDTYWDAYAADLAKEIAVKVANKYNDPKQAAEYAVQTAEAVVAGLKKE